MSTVDLTTVPTFLSSNLGIPLFAGQILTTMIVMMLFLLPCFILTRNPVIYLIVTFMSMGFSIAVGWLSVYFLIIIMLFIALMYSTQARKWITG